ncbi:uncharacterized protein TRAVEDRAFT_74055 [Trametes versicolor FP-101664 SS1]|uniref:uncharacterized protein n=1 Tax=Trametes versicolor (strain FP-101664) TaxID=717944 RepID=UPI0004621AA6|nr:uncharacterized protein TRAVEDRAFT_74055 [Trametes versicolor FP-101664 SS1]EIW55095.1 hypothetical protein TRAVEDRAFT_74055 [Trametes versicolor FP-101664 SS1]
MAPAPRKSEAEIDKLADPRTPPHIILRTLPSLSFATPTHSIRVQLSFQFPTPHKLLAMPEQTAVDVQHTPDPRYSFGGPAQPYNTDPSTRTQLDTLQERMATKYALDSLIKEVDRRTEVTNGKIDAISTAFDEFKDTTFKEFQTKREVFEKETRESLRSHSTQIANVSLQVGGLREEVEGHVEGLKGEVQALQNNMNERLDALMAIILRIPGVEIPAASLATVAPPSVPIVTTTPLPRNRESPVTFHNPHDSDTSSLPDSLLYPPLEPPSPSGLSPSSLKPPSLRKRISTASMNKVTSVTKTVQGVFSRLKTAKHNIEDTMQDLDAMTQMLQAGQQQDDALLPSPQEYESPVAGPSTPTETQTASKGKSKLKLGQPIQRDRQ